MKPPQLIMLNDFDGDWDAYEAALYEIFVRDILRHDLRFRGIPVNARRVPEHNRKWACFWHLISEGRVEDDRIPDLRRCERLPLIRWIIENADTAATVDAWEQARRGGGRNWLLWHREEYLVVLAQRRDYFLLKTAFCTDRAHRVGKFRKERDAYHAARR